MNRHPLTQPTVYIDAVPWLRWRLAAMRWVEVGHHRAVVRGAALVLALLAGGVGLLLAA